MAKMIPREGRMYSRLVTSDCEPADEYPDNLKPDMTGAEMSALLDRIPGAWESVEIGRRQADAGETIPLEEL
jgi:hypothetical protein